MRIVLTALIRWKGLTLAPVTLNRYFASQKDAEKFKTEMRKQYAEMGLDNVDIDFHLK
jgi:hypothetical protein